ncbi:MAG: HD domain-containing protein [Treponema sp.]|nr:HD domain-containing protein [Treponema sp.]
MAQFDLDAYKPSDTLNAGQIIRIANRMLFNINNSIVLHNERTAYLALKIAQAHPLNKNCSISNLVVLALFHTLGFFRQDILYNETPFDSDIQFFSQEKRIESKYMFAYYYLAFMTPLKNTAQALEGFNLPFNEPLKQYLYQTDYKSVIYMCARVSDFVAKNPDAQFPADVNEIAPEYFDPEFAQAFNELNKNNALINNLKTTDYFMELERYLYKLRMNPDDTHQALKLLVYFLDFKSTVTVTHTINTSCYALSLGKRLKLEDEDLNTLFTAAIVHDIGKIATPTRILEFPGKLSPEDMGIMRYHVNHTKRILGNIVSRPIFEAASRHHEKLTGKGYPSQLPAEELNTVQRTLTIADITSALTDNRSYKGEFSKEHTLGIINKMTEEGELDPDIVKVLNENFDNIREEQKYLQTFLKVDFSNVLKEYNDYLYNDSELITNNIENMLEEVEELDEASAIPELVEGLEEIEELEEL